MQTYHAVQNILTSLCLYSCLLIRFLLNTRLKYTMASSTDREQVFQACDRFFAIPELVEIFLEKASIQVLMNCQRVCNAWKGAIDRSDRLQEALFVRAAASTQAIELNPILRSHFAPILAPPVTNDEEWNDEHSSTKEMISQNCNASQLSSLPWARDGKALDAKARQAYARPEASWRNMFVSQPPISRLDWWHKWVEKSFVSENSESGDWELRSRARGSTDVIAGWGHQDLNDTHITIGMLWDLVEARLVRGCRARLMYFPVGKRFILGQTDFYLDYSTIEEEIWACSDNSQKRGWTFQMPRVQLQTRQIWDGVPHQQGFDAEAGEWKAMPDREVRAADGFNLLRQDCAVEDENEKRWSKSEAFQWREIDWESSGRGW